MRFALLALLVACGGDATIPDDTAQSGSRLKLSWFVFDDGTRAWDTTLFDSKLGVTCTPMTWADGETHCTPQLSPIAFFDAACSTEPVVRDNAAFAFDLRLDFCRSNGLPPTVPNRMYERISDEAMTRTTAFQIDETGQCQPIPLPPMGRLTGFPARELESPDLVRLTKVYAGEGRIRVETLSGSDGTLLPMRLYDTELDAACNSLGVANSQGLPCALEAAESKVFSDLGCQVPAIFGSSDTTCVPAIAAVDVDGSICPDYFEVGATPEPFAFTNSFGNCLEAQKPAGALVYAATSHIEPVMFSREATPSAARLQFMYVTDGKTRMRDRTILYDAELDTECVISQRLEDSYTCTPASDGGSYVGGFADALCTQPVGELILLRDFDVDGCRNPKPPKYNAFGTTVHLIGPPYTQPVYNFASGVCTQITFLESTPHTIAETIPAARIPRALRTRDL